MPRERIIAVGANGSGKTYGWLQLARHLPQKQFFVLDTDLTVDRSLPEFPDVVASGNVKGVPTVDWADYQAALKEALVATREGDWIVVDSITRSWSAVRRYFSTEIFGKDMGAYFLEARKNLNAQKKSFGKSGGIFDGWKDWPVINRLYEDFIYPLVFRTKANLYFTAEPTSVGEDDSTDTRDLFGPYGVRPGGQKSLGHQVDTVLLLAHRKTGWVMTTMKDRGGRAYTDHLSLVDLYLQYGKVAGWLNAEDKKAYLELMKRLRSVE